MNDNHSSLRRATLKETGDVFYIGNAASLSAALRGMAERAVGCAPSREPFSIHPEVLARMEEVKP